MNQNKEGLKMKNLKSHLITIILSLFAAVAFSQDGYSKPEGSEQHFSANTAGNSKGYLRPRVIVSSDFPPTDVVMRGAPADHCSDPDDMQSMVRFLLYTNEFDVEALIASSGTFANIAKKQNILDVLDLYDQVDENLRRHDPLYPTADALRAVTFQGRSGTWGKSTSNNIGAGKDSKASNAIISIVDKPDPRPVWFCVWGDCSNIVQAVCKVQNTRSTAELQTFLSKMRIHQIAHQDDTIDWLLANFPDLFIIYSRKTYQGMFGGSDPISNLAWVNTNIRNDHGPLCAVYPPAGMGCSGMCEGDSPSFLHLVSAVRGLNDPEDPTQPSWGGQFKRDGTTNHYVDRPGGVSISKWRPDYQAEFQERADWCINLTAPLKPRMIVLTDISPANHEPDDMESMIRLLVHADLFEIEGLIATTGWSYSQATTNSLNLINEVIDAYEKDLPNLLKRSGQTDFLSDESRQEIGYWPSPDYLRSRAVMGSKNRGQSHIGEGNDSPGSKLIIQIAGESDDRPVWVQAWGGGNTLAQAIWRVREEQDEDELKTFLHKIRMYTITDQDRDYRSGTPFDISSHQWMRREFKKDLFFIWDECAWRFQNGTGKSNWDEYETHIQKHGNLGDIYPKYKYGVEGDTPAFLYIMPVGLNNPDIPGQGSWGGYFEWAKGPDNETYAYTNHQNPAKDNCYKLEKHFYEATFNNFAARMDWAKDGAGNRNPVVAVNGDEGMDIITLASQQGMPVTLDASESHDPDGDDLTFNWWIISGPGTYTQNIKILNNNTSRATVEVPEKSAGKTFHVICEVTDDGTPNLTSYRRIIFEPVE
jgi:hypothetical protein